MFFKGRTSNPIAFLLSFERNLKQNLWLFYGEAIKYVP